MRILQLVDRAAGGVIAAGALSGPVIGLFTRRPGYRRNQAVKIYYGVIGTAAAYTALRQLAPPTAKERRLAAASDWYDRADGYRKQVKTLHKAAHKLWRKRDQLGREVTAKLPKVYTPSAIS
jgi:hypothetical protein